MISVGVDGCRFGWIAVSKRNRELDYGVFATAQSLVDAHRDAKRIFIDMPMGLPWRDYPIRECETLARRALQSRRSSVFSVPCRRAAHARTIDEARTHNIAELGRSLSAQAWNICAKIAELDTLLLSKTTSALICEVHPELAFTQLSGGTPLRHSKKTAAGIRERVALLKRYEAKAPQLLRRVLDEQRRTDVSADDVLDALVVYVVSTFPKSHLHTLPSRTRCDERGIPMQIVFGRPTSAANASARRPR